MTDVMIQAKNLSKSFGNVKALDRVSFDVHQGEVVGFLGPNGAGKSTTMRILTCYIAATGGDAKVHGFDVFDNPLKVREKIGYLPQRAPLYGDMGVAQYLKFAADIRGLDESTFKKRLKSVVEVCGLARVLASDIATLSHGYRQRVGLAQALIHNPPILILDEPTSDLDPNEKAEVIKYIQEIGKDRTILLSTHNLSEVEAACARAIIVSKGRVVADGSLDDLRARSGSTRYVVTLDAEAGGKKLDENQVIAALEKLQGTESIATKPSDKGTLRFEFAGPQEGDMRAEVSRLVMGQGWTLLELKREAQSLESVFRGLTRGDEKLDRGESWDDDDDHDDDSDDDEEEEDDDDEDTSDSDDDSDDDDNDDDDDDDDDNDDKKKGDD